MRQRQGSTIERRQGPATRRQRIVADEARHRVAIDDLDNRHGPVRSAVAVGLDLETHELSRPDHGGQRQHDITGFTEEFDREGLVDGATGVGVLVDLHLAVGETVEHEVDEDLTVALRGNVVGQPDLPRSTGDRCLWIDEDRAIDQHPIRVADAHLDTIQQIVGPIHHGAGCAEVRLERDRGREGRAIVQRDRQRLRTGVKVRTDREVQRRRVRNCELPRSGGQAERCDPAARRGRDRARTWRGLRAVVRGNHIHAIEVGRGDRGDRRAQRHLDVDLFGGQGPIDGRIRIGQQDERTMGLRDVAVERELDGVGLGLVGFDIGEAVGAATGRGRLEWNSIRGRQDDLDTILRRRSATVEVAGRDRAGDRCRLERQCHVQLPRLTGSQGDDLGLGGEPAIVGVDVVEERQLVLAGDQIGDGVGTGVRSVTRIRGRRGERGEPRILCSVDADGDLGASRAVHDLAVRPGHQAGHGGRLSLQGRGSDVGLGIQPEGQFLIGDQRLMVQGLEQQLIPIADRRHRRAGQPAEPVGHTFLSRQRSVARRDLEGRREDELAGRPARLRDNRLSVGFDDDRVTVGIPDGIDQRDRDLAGGHVQWIGVVVVVDDAVDRPGHLTVGIHNQGVDQPVADGPTVGAAEQFQVGGGCRQEPGLLHAEPMQVGGEVAEEGGRELAQVHLDEGDEPIAAPRPPGRVRGDVTGRERGDIRELRRGEDRERSTLQRHLDTGPWPR